ncbi:MAG TPA: ribosome recycling factor [Rhabdochlamydiaceae bacterium]|nr:ribosome recycling factor [Rhabdochlamydiaceae bacterium]
MSIPDQAKTKMQAALEHFKQELKNLRTNRANPGMIDGVTVEVYGTQMRIRDLATVTVPEPRMLLVSPFDPQTAGPISKAIEKANLNLQPILEGNIIRINVPPMDESVRKEIVKVGKKKAEDAKIVIRDIRRKNNELVRKQKADGDITEDVMKKAEKTIQDLTDQFCKEIDDLFAAKEKEIMVV